GMAPVRSPDLRRRRRGLFLRHGLEIPAPPSAVDLRAVPRWVVHRRRPPGGSCTIGDPTGGPGGAHHADVGGVGTAPTASPRGEVRPRHTRASELTSLFDD